MKKRILAIFLIFALCIPCFTACGIFETISDEDKPRKRNDKTSETTENTSTEYQTDNTEKNTEVTSGSVSEGEVTSAESSNMSSDEELSKETTADETVTRDETSDEMTADSDTSEEDTKDGDTNENYTTETEDETAEELERVEFEFVSNGDGTCRLVGVVCQNITSIVVPDLSLDGEYVVGIDEYAFYDAYYAVSITLPETIKRIEDYAFYTCANLENINIPESLKSLSGTAFSECSKLLEIEGDIAYVDTWAVGCVPTQKNVVLREGTVGIASGTFTNYTVYSINIPQSIKVICNNAFDGRGFPDTVYYYGEEDDWNAIQVNYDLNEPLKTADVVYMNRMEIKDEYSEGFEFISYGDGTCYLSSIGACKDKYVLIPSKSPMGEKVVAIGESAFEGADVKCVKIPEGVVSIGERAFFTCEGLKYVYIPDSLKSIGKYAFYECEALEHFNISNNIEYVGGYAFYRCSRIITKSYKEAYYLGTDSNPYFMLFSAISKIEETYEIHPDTKIICSNAFAFCEDFKTIEIPNGVTFVGGYAFERCSSLENLKLPESVTVIGESVFSECESLKSVELSSNITSIGDNSFNGCRALQSIDIPDSVVSIGMRAFSGCEMLSEVSLPDGIESVGEYAFSECSNLDLYEYDNAYYIGNKMNPYIMLYAVKDDSVTSLIISNDTKIIGNDVLYNCEKLQSLMIPSNVIEIGSRAFGSCIGLESITVAKDNNAYASKGNCLIDIKSKTLILGCKNSIIPSDGSVAVIGDYAFKGIEDLKAIVVPEGVTHIGDEVFSGCAGMESVSLPTSLISIGVWAFSGCVGLSDIDIPDGVKNIGRDAFEACYDIIEYEDNMQYVDKWLIECNSVKRSGIVIKENTVGIADEAFYYYPEIYCITIPKNIVTISKNAFVGCDGLIEICNLSTLDITAGSSDFGNVAARASLLRGTDVSFSTVEKKESRILLSISEAIPPPFFPITSTETPHMRSLCMHLRDAKISRM